MIAHETTDAVLAPPDGGLGRTRALKRALARLQAGGDAVLATAVVSEDGLLLASRLQDGLDEGHIAALGAALLSIAGKASEHLRAGRLERIYLEGSDGHVVVTSAGPHGMLLVLARKDAKLGLVFLDVSDAAAEVRRILS